jgi:3-hydroxymyristoyl/3-hydroxydecanoyl-(acyl carrier protein) dehydratase
LKELSPNPFNHTDQTEKGTGQAHRAFLKARADSLQQMNQLVQMQVQVANNMLGQPTQVISNIESKPMTKPALFNEEQVRQATRTSMASLFGPEFSIYEGRHFQCLPSGDLQFVTRILSFSGEKHSFDLPVSMVAEFDVPLNAWYFQDSAFPSLPYTALMEITLQTCGFLSASIGTPMLYPEQDYFFRVLDGEAVVETLPEITGATLTIDARLTRTRASKRAIAQDFEYSIHNGTQLIYHGNASAAYFVASALKTQSGLDPSGSISPWIESTEANQHNHTLISLSPPDQAPDYYFGDPEKPHFHLGHDQMDLIDEAVVIPGGGKAGLGYIYANRKNDPDGWFFPLHFNHDPVMPGSLGVEAVLQALHVYAIQQGLGIDFHSPHFALTANQSLIWKFRGQVLTPQKNVSLEVHITSIKRESGRVILTGDASLWTDSTRIYEVPNASISIIEG